MIVSVSLTLLLSMAGSEGTIIEGRPLSAWSELLSAPEVSARRFAARTLAAKVSSKCTDLIPALESALRDPDFRVRKSTIAALEKIDRLACREAAARLADDLAAPGARLPAVRALGELKPQYIGPVEVRKLDAAMRANRDDSAFYFTAARSAAILAPKLYTKEAAKLLIEGLKHPSAEVRTLAAAGLGDIGVAVYTQAKQPLTDALNSDNDPRVRVEAARSLARIDRSLVRVTINPVIDVLKSADADAQARAAAAYVLGDLRSIGDFGATTQQAVDRLREGLSDDDAGVRLATASALYQIDVKTAEAEACPVLIALLRDDDKERVLATVEMLKSIGPKASSAVPALVIVLRKSSDDLPALLSVVDTLAQIGEPAVPELIGLLTDSRAEVGAKRGAIDALAKIGKPAKAAIPELVLILKGPDKFLPRFAATALAKIGPDAMLELYKLLKDGDPRVRAYAAQAIGEAGLALGRPIIPELKGMSKDDPDAMVREVAAQAVRQLGATP